MCVLAAIAGPDSGEERERGRVQLEWLKLISHFPLQVLLYQHNILKNSDTFGTAQEKRYDVEFFSTALTSLLTLSTFR